MKSIGIYYNYKNNEKMLLLNEVAVLKEKDVYSL